MNNPKSNSAKLIVMAKHIMRKENVSFNTAIEIISKLEDNNLIDVYFADFFEELNMYNRGDLL